MKMRLYNMPKSCRLLQAPLSGEIDENIAALVTLMREVGFSTVSSCEGHFRDNDFKHVRPNVIFNALDRGLLHAWIREVGKNPLSLPVGFSMGPTWNPETDVVHEDNWGIELDMSWCETLEEATVKKMRRF